MNADAAKGTQKAQIVEGRANGKSDGDRGIFRKSELERLCGNPTIFVGRGFTHDIKRRRDTLSASRRLVSGSC